MVRWFVLALLLGGMAGPAWAEPPRLDLPVDCDPGESCWIVKHVDHAPGEPRRDWGCGRLTGVDDTGTDFAVRDGTVMARGVTVQAAAPGRVVGLRDGMPDVNIRRTDRARVKDRECGNGVLLDHGDGWFTQYCHLKKGSIGVRKGQRVPRGAPLGAVGLSGLTEFPHMEFVVRHGDAVVDPFTGGLGEAACGDDSGHLWTKAARAALGAYRPVSLYNAGFATEKPDRLAVRDGAFTATAAGASAPVLLWWVEIFGLKAGDVITTRLTGPGGGTVARDRQVMDAPMLQMFRYIGRKRPPGGWPVGGYQGTVWVTRDGAEVARLARTFTITPR